MEQLLPSQPNPGERPLPAAVREVFEALNITGRHGALSGLRESTIRSDFENPHIDIESLRQTIRFNLASMRGELADEQ